MSIREGHGGTINLFQCGSNEQGEDKKKGLQSKTSQKFWSSSQNSCNFPRIKSEGQKKRSSFQNFSEIRCESTKITQIRAINTYLEVLGFDLHSGSPEPVNFFGAQSSLGGTIFIWGGTAPECPPVAPGLNRISFDDHVD